MQKGEIFRTPLRIANLDNCGSKQQFETSFRSIGSGSSSHSSHWSSNHHKSEDGSEYGNHSRHTSRTAKVRAPADLPGGYRFKATFGDRSIVAIVV